VLHEAKGKDNSAKRPTQQVRPDQVIPLEGDFKDF
jgi:hypothetical protein